MDTFKLILITSLIGICLSQLILNPQKAEVLEGESVLLTCSLERITPFIYHESRTQWTWIGSNNQHIRLHVYRRRNVFKISDRCSDDAVLGNTTLYSVECDKYRSSILFRNITRNRHDERWECLYDGYNKSNTASVYVMVPVTSVQIQPTRNLISTTENSIINMSCQTSFARPAPNVTWFLTEDMPGKESQVPFLDGITKRIHNSTEELFSTKSEISYQVNRSFDGRRIYCSANNYPRKTASSEKILFEVKYMASVISFHVKRFEGKDIIMVVENDTVQFTCLIDTVASNVKLKFRWKTVVVEEFDTSNLTYTLHRVSCRDTGDYACVARNALNFEESSIRRQTLLVKCPPRVDPSTLIQDSVQAKPGDTATFSLPIIAYPEPQLSDIVWMKLRDANWTMISNSLHTEISVRGLQTNLKIKNVAEDDYGIYRLTVTNGLGTYSQNFNLTNAVEVGTEERSDNKMNVIVISSISGIVVLTGIIGVAICLTRKTNSKRKNHCMNGDEVKKTVGSTPTAAESNEKPTCSKPQNMYEEIHRHEVPEEEYQEIQLGEDDMCLYKNI